MMSYCLKLLREQQTNKQASDACISDGTSSSLVVSRLALISNLNTLTDGSNILVVLYIYLSTVVYLMGGT
jgi:hypothetical protein